MGFGKVVPSEQGYPFKVVISAVVQISLAKEDCFRPNNTVSDVVATTAVQDDGDKSGLVMKDVREEDVPTPDPYKDSNDAFIHMLLEGLVDGCHNSAARIVIGGDIVAV